MEHVSVLREEVKKLLNLQGGETVVDMTLGLGGHAKEIVNSIGKKGRLIAFEQDERNLEEAQRRLKDYSGQITYIQDNFRYLKTRITGIKIDKVDAIFFDLGLSSPHVDEASRGFSFMKEGPLDMRFNGKEGITAAEVINNYREDELARVIYEYGEERLSRMIARKICDRRKNKLFTTTVELATFMEQIMPRSKGKGAKKVHAATRIFQALRIEVNDEMNALKEALNQAAEVVKVGGRIAVISYHSLEDRMVKHFFRELELPPVKDEKEALYRSHGEPLFESITNKPVVPTDEEVSANPRSRSAKLRVYQKLKEIM